MILFWVLYILKRKTVVARLYLLTPVEVSTSSHKCLTSSIRVMWVCVINIEHQKPGPTVTVTVAESSYLWSFEPAKRMVSREKKRIRLSVPSRTSLLVTAYQVTPLRIDGVHH